jgi:maltooligosyltrehalose trehalohydrolase
MLARCLAQGFAYQGERSAYRQGKPRGSPSDDLAPTAFVLFLQNHDQIGNRPFGDRLVEHADPEALEAAIALQLLCPQIPLIFMGEEAASRTPFLYFTDHHGELAKAVREGRRREFAGFEGFQPDETADAIPDPNAPQTFECCRPEADGEQGVRRRVLYAKLLALRAAVLMPQLEGAQAMAAHAAGVAGALARWRLADASVLTIACNLGPEPCPIEPPDGGLLFESRAGAGEQALHGQLQGRATIAFLEPPG